MIKTLSISREEENEIIRRIKFYEKIESSSQTLRKVLNRKPTNEEIAEFIEVNEFGELTPVNDLIEEINSNYRLTKSKLTKKLIEGNMKLVNYIARKYARGDQSLYEDLCQEGVLGLMKSITKFDETSGNRFSTYAQWWIRQVIQLYLSNNGRTIRAPVYVVDSVNKILKARSELSHQLNRAPSEEEIAEHLDIDIEKIRDFESATMNTASLDFKIGEETILGDVIEDEEHDTPDQIYENQEKEKIIGKVLSKLKEREEHIIRWRFGIGVNSDHTLEEIAIKLNLTKERVRQIENQALGKLKKGDSLRLLKEFVR